MDIFKSLFYQHKGGKGVSGPPPKKGIKRYLFISYTYFWKLCRLNLLFILFCLPIVTIPPSLAAMSRVLLKMAREGNTFIFSDFFAEFKSSFFKSWIAFIPWLFVIAVTVVGYRAIDNVYSSTLQIILWVMICSLVYCHSIYCFCMIALIDLPIAVIMKNAAIMVITEFRRNVFMILTTPIFILSAIYLLYALPLLLFLAFSFVGLINVMIANEVIENRVIKPKIKEK